MKKIILASSSPQRRKLLKHLGLKFSLCPSRVAEEKKIRTTKADLVMHNALLKAQDVSSRLKEGLVIGADTLVFTGNGKLIAKPRDLKEAKRHLKMLFSSPSWVYTGVALIDAQSQKRVVDYEKTKVFMRPLTDEEIDRYHAQVSPLDKAGGFDIEGRGSIFIRRIEGCYFNVIGLPLSKLCLMLKEFGVSILMLCVIFGAAGCSTEYNLATGQQETLMYGTEKEISIGAALSLQLEKSSKINTELDVNKRVQRILNRLVKVCDRQELVYTIKVIDEDKLNAVSLPGGYVYVYKGLIDAVDSDDQLACVIGHELGHIGSKHSIKKLQSIYGYTLLQLAAIQSRNGQLAGGLNTAFLSIFLAYSQEDEFWADKLGVKYAKKAGYDPKGMAQFLKKLKEKEDKEPLQPFSYWRTHPFIPERIAAVNQDISGQIGFRDYLNLTGEK